MRSMGCSMLNMFTNKSKNKIGYLFGHVVIFGGFRLVSLLGEDEVMGLGNVTDMDMTCW